MEMDLEPASMKIAHSLNSSFIASYGTVADEYILGSDSARKGKVLRLFSHTNSE